MNRKSGFRDMIERHPNLDAIMGNVRYFVKWMILSLMIGILIGVIGAGFSYTISFATAFRKAHKWIIWLLPFAGLLIVFIYHLFRDYDDHGTNQIIAAITGEERVPIRKAPLIFVSTAITHLFGGSAGREGAALQMGGCIGQNIGFLFRMDDSSRKILTMCGMSAAFAALFGTPMSAAFLGMEISSVGVMYYAALVPCVVSALTANAMAQFLGAEADVFQVVVVPGFNPYHGVVTALLAIICALVSILFCLCLHKGGDLFRRLFKNQYLRIFVAGAAVSVLTWLSGTTIYNGAGMDVIKRAVVGSAPMWAFLIKIVFTTLTMSSGYKGGEIVPALYIGATLGCTFARLGDFNPMICASVGMGALFCGITNCPITALLLCFEMFGYKGMPYYLLAIALSYTFSGYYSVYGSQKIVYSKHIDKYINRSAH